MLRAWRALDRCEGRSTLRTWLFSIAATSASTSSRGKGRQVLPVDLGRSWPATAEPPSPRPITSGSSRCRTTRCCPGSDPAAVAAARDTIRLAFVAALQHLQPRQRAVLPICATSSAGARRRSPICSGPRRWRWPTLQRARATMAERDPAARPRSDRLQGEDVLLDRYVEAFERFDIEALVALLHEDATLSMPPHPLWVQGREQIRRWWCEHRAVCGASRLVQWPPADRPRWPCTAPARRDAIRSPSRSSTSRAAGSATRPVRRPPAAADVQPRRHRTRLGLGPVRSRGGKAAATRRGRPRPPSPCRAPVEAVAHDRHGGAGVDVGIGGRAVHAHHPERRTRRPRGGTARPVRAGPRAPPSGCP